MKRNATIGRLLRRNLSKIQIAGFIISNFIGLAIVISGIQFYSDVKSVWTASDSFINRDYIILNKKITSSHTFGISDAGFTQQDISQLRSQPWVRRLGVFTNADYEVKAFMEQGGRGMSTNMFLEALPDSFIDVKTASWHYEAGRKEVPVIISKDYLTLYNFGFAGSAGLPQLSEGMLSSIPLRLRLSDRKGEKSMEFVARIAGYSGRLNTILVPEEFMKWSNETLGSDQTRAPQRVILEVNSPGDVAITDYLESHDLEQAGSEESSKAAYFLRLVSGVIIGIGALITFLSFFILLLSVALLMQKNKEKLHSLIMLGYPLAAVGRPYKVITLYAAVASYALAIVAMLVFRNIYISGLSSLLGPNETGVAVSLICGAVLVLFTVAVNFLAISRKVRGSFYS